MKATRVVAAVVLALDLAVLPAVAQTSGSKAMAVVGNGSAFRLDTTPVTNGEFLAFVAAHPEWRRDRIERVFAEPDYLVQWEGDDVLGAGASADAPVVNVSWFAARAFCASRGARLPTESEWERAAAASLHQADGSGDAAWRMQIADLYSRPAARQLPRVGASRPNFWGVYDLHGVVWEWVLDFASSASALRGGCGAVAAAVANPTDFAAFERSAFRSSLHASYTLRNLGFRCAADIARAP